uniref:hypothetical protein n=1 Tax=Caballeronia sordidicola TaxID=196367 RepID=UPI0015C1AF7B|nr:hypothetical protein [Caballeronia sordidicola]
MAAYRDLTDALEAVKAGRHVEGPALDVLTGIMANLREQYAAGVDGLRDSVGQLSEGSTVFAEFSAAALDKIDRLDQFYQEVYAPSSDSPNAAQRLRQRAHVDLIDCAAHLLRLGLIGRVTAHICPANAFQELGECHASALLNSA